MLIEHDCCAITKKRCDLRYGGILAGEWRRDWDRAHFKSVVRIEKHQVATRDRFPRTLEPCGAPGQTLLSCSLHPRGRV